MLDADAGAEQLHAAAGAGGLDLRGLELGGVAEVLRDRGREREHRRRADDVDGIAGHGLAGEGRLSAQHGHGDQGLLHPPGSQKAVE
jgi:hypothetical protein